MKQSMIVLQSRLLCQMFAGLTPSVSICLSKSSKEHTNAESSAKGFFVVHQSSGKDFALFMLFCMSRQVGRFPLCQRLSEVGEV